WGGYRRIYIQGLVVAIVASIGVGVRAMALFGRPKPPPEPQSSSHWRFKELYFNPDDPALFVPARRGQGWTVNFGRLGAILLIVMVLAIGIGAPYALVRYLIN